MTLQLECEKIGQVTVLTVKGEVDLATSPRLRVAVGEAIRRAARVILIDLCGVSFMDTPGLSALMYARRRTDARGIELKLACDEPSTLKLLAVTRLDRDFRVYPSAAAALNAAVAQPRADRSAAPR